MNPLINVKIARGGPFYRVLEDGNFSMLAAGASQQASEALDWISWAYDWHGQASFAGTSASPAFFEEDQLKEDLGI